jgi:hypothetical protein
VASTTLATPLTRRERTAQAPNVRSPLGLDVPRPGSDPVGDILRDHALETTGYAEDSAMRGAQRPGGPASARPLVRTPIAQVVVDLGEPTELIAAQHLPAGFDEARSQLSNRLAARPTAKELSPDQLTAATLAVCVATAADPGLRQGAIDHLVGFDLGSALRGEGPAAAPPVTDAQRAAMKALRTLAGAGGTGAETVAGLLRGEGTTQPDSVQLRTLTSAADAIDPARTMPVPQWLGAARRTEAAITDAPAPAGAPAGAWPNDAQLRSAGVANSDIERRIPALAIAAIKAEMAAPNVELSPAQSIAKTLARSGLMTPQDVATVEQGLHDLVGAARPEPPASFTQALTHPRLPSVTRHPPINQGDGLLTIQRGAQDSARVMADLGLKLAHLAPEQMQTMEQKAGVLGRVAFLHHWGHNMPLDSQLRHRVVAPEEAEAIAAHAAELAGQQGNPQFLATVKNWAQSQLRDPATLQRESDRTQQEVGALNDPAVAAEHAALMQKLESSMDEAIRPAQPLQGPQAGPLSPMRALAAEIEKFELATSVKVKTSHSAGLVDPAGAALGLARAARPDERSPIAPLAGISAAFSREAELEANLGAHGVELAFRRQNKANVKGQGSVAGSGSAGIGGAFRGTQGETRVWPAGPGSVLYVRLPRTPGAEGGVADGERGFKGDRLRAQTMADLVRQMEQMSAAGENDWTAKLALACPQVSFTSVADPSAESEISRTEVDVTGLATAGVPRRPLIGAAAGGIAFQARPDTVRTAQSAGGSVDVERLTLTASYKTGLEGNGRLGPIGIAPLVGAAATLHQGGTVTSTVLTSKDGQLHASDSYRTLRFQSLNAALKHFDNNVETYARLSVEGDGRVNGIIEGRVDKLMADPAIQQAGIERAWLVKHEQDIEIAARAQELRANIQDSPTSVAKTYTSYELMKAEVGDRLNALQTVQGLASESPALAAAAAQARQDHERLAQSADSYRPVVIYEARRETSTDAVSVPLSTLSIESAQQTVRAHAST